MIRVAVVHPVPFAGELTVHALKKEKDFRVVDHLFTAGVARAKLSANNCDVVLISTHLPEDNALSLIRFLHKEYPALELIVVGLKEDEDTVVKYVAAGATAYVPEAHSLEELLSTLRTAVQGEAHIPPTIITAMIQRISELSRLRAPRQARMTALASLTRREEEVAELIANGWSNRNIAEFLTLEVGTVKNHVHHVLTKLNVRNRHEAAAAYLALTGCDHAPLAVGA